MAVQFVYNYFFDRHIPINDDWLSEAIVYVQSQTELLNHEALAAAVYEQWIFSDIKTSTEPTLSLPTSASASKKFVFNSNAVLQVNSVIDISASLLSQFMQLTYEFEDNSGFDVRDDDEKSEDMRTITKARRMLLMELTDGQTTIKAFEYRPIRELSLLTCPGCKILLMGTVVCRRNILLLTESNCVLLGGEDETLMKTNRPIEIMARALGKDLSNKFAPGKSSKVTRDRGGGSAAQNDAVEKRRPVERSATQHSDQLAIGATGDVRRKNCSSDWLQTDSLAAPQAGTGNSHQILSKPTARRPVMEVKPIADRDGAFVGISQSASPSSYVSVSNTTSTFKRSHTSKGDEETPRSGHVATSRTISRERIHQSTSLRAQNEPKRIKVEVCDDEITVIGVKQSDSLFSSTQSPMNKGAPIASPQSALASQRQYASDSMLLRYRGAEIVFIADALSTTRFALGSIRRNIVAMMREVKVPLRIVDDIWTMTVVLTDESCKKLECIVAHSVLVDLIGLTPQEAVAIRASNDKSRRREGTLRLRSVQESMERLDVVWEVEFYGCANSTPVVRKMQTLAQKLGLIR